MPITSKEIKVPNVGLKYELSSELLTEEYSPRALNVHGIDSEIKTKFGLSYFNSDDSELERLFYYDLNDDSHVHLRLDAADNVKLSQSFTTAAALRTFDRITLKLKHNGTITAGKLIWLTIEGDSSGPDGSAITNGTSQTVLCSVVTSTAGWITFTFTTPVSVNSETKYWIVLQGDYDVSATNNIEWEIDTTSSPYTDGAAFVLDASWAATGADQDFMFRIYTDNAFVMLVDTFYLTTGYSYFVVCTLDRMFYWNVSTTAWVDITGSLASNMFTGTIDDAFSADAYPATDTYMVTNYVNNIKKWTASGNIADLGGSPPRAKFLRVYKDHLILGYVYEVAADRPQRIRWSDAGNMEAFTGGTSGYHDFYEGIDFVNGIFFLNDYIVITKERSIYIGYAVSTSYVFQFDLRISGIGPMSGSLVLEKGNELLMVCWDDIYAFNGTEIASIADGSIRKEFFDTTDPENSLRSFSMDIEELSEWHIFVPSTGSDYPDREWIFNYNSKAWWRCSLSVPVTAMGWYVEQAGITINDLVGTIDQQLWRLNDRTITGFNALNMLGTSTGRIAKIDFQLGEEFGVGVESYVDTKDFFFVDENGKRIRGKINGVFFKASGSHCYVYYSIDQGNSYHILDVSGFTLSPDSSLQKYKFRLNVEQIRFRIYKSAIGDNFSLSTFGFDVQKGGRI